MLYYYLVISLVTFILWGLDKFRARAGWWRISEQTLITLVCLGGAFGALAGMLIFRHKTRKPKFWAWVVGAGCLHLAILLFLM